MVFEMSIQDFHDQPHDHMYPHHNGGGGGLDYREGSFISEEVKGYQEPGVYHSDSQVGTVFIRISVPELKLQKCLQFELDETVWQAKQRILGSFAKDLKDSINYGLYCPPMNGRAGKFLDEERLLREYPLQGPIGFLEFKYKKRVYKMMHVNVRKLKQLHVKGNLRHFIDYVKTCNLEKVNKMTNKGLDPNFHDSSTGETPLCLAVSLCKPKCRELIISLAGGGAHLDFRNKKGQTALHVAVVAGNTEALKTLLDLGVSPNMKDSRSLTPLYYTVSHCTSPTCMEMLLQERAFIGAQDEQGWFEIHHACRQGLVQHLEHLLFYGADMDVQNASGNTALHVCALHNRESCLRVLLFRGANKEILNYSNQSPYESAILAGNETIAEILEGHKDDDVVQFRETPRFSTRRRDSVASAAMYALYRSRSDPRINHILISPSSSTQSFSHLHNSQTTTDSYSGSRGTDSPCSMSLSSSSSGPVLGVGEQGFWEGRVNNNEGMFPSNFVQEVKLRRKAGSLGDLVSATRHDMLLNRNTLAAIVPNYSEYAPRSVVLQKGPEGYGFVLRGAKSQTQSAAELDFRPSAEFPALQYLDSVDPGSRADRAGLKTGDFILEINGENVVRASHDRVVQLIRQSGDTLALKVVTVKPLDKPDHWLQHHNGTMTLPNRGGAPRRQAPQPPQRDPQTSLSVGKAQGKQYAEGMAELERTVQELNSSTEDQLDLALAEYEKQTMQSVVSSEQKTASIRSKHSAKRVSCIELDKIENPDSKAATSKGKGKDYMSPSEMRIQKYHHKKNGNLERSSSTPSLVDKKNEAVYATPTVPPSEQNDMGHRRSSSGAAISHIYATPGERPRAPPPPPPANSANVSPKRQAPAPPRPPSEIISISTDRRKSSLGSVTDSLQSNDKPASEYESSFRPGISAQLSTEPKISTPSLQQAKLRSHNRNSSQVSVQSSDSGGSKRSEEKLAVTFADDKIHDQANQFLQKYPNAHLVVTADVHGKKDKKMSEPEPDYDIDEMESKANKVTVISVGGGVDTSKKFTVKSDIPSGNGGMVIPPPPSEPAPKPPSHKPPSPLPKPAKQSVDVRASPSADKKVVEETTIKNFETLSVESEDALYATVSKPSKAEPPKAPPAPPAPPPPPPAPPAPGMSGPLEKPKTPPPPVAEKKPKNPVQGIPSKDIMEAVLQRKTRIESEGMKISTGPQKEAPVKDGNDLRNRMLDNTHSAILAAVAKRRALLEEKDSEHSVAEEIENRLQKTKKLQSAKYYFSSETIQKKEAEKTNKAELKTENGPKEITPTIVKPTTPTSVSNKTTKPPSPVPSKKNKPPSPAPVRKINPPAPGAKTLPSATKTTAATAGVSKILDKSQAAPKPIYSSSAKPPSPKMKKAPSPVPVKSPVSESAPDKPREAKSETSVAKEGEMKEKDENEDLLAKARARLDWLQKKSSTTSLKSPRDVSRNPSKVNSPRRTASKAGSKTESSPARSVPKTNGMTLPLKAEPEGTSVQSKSGNSAKSPVQIQSTKLADKSGITPMKTSKDSELLKNKNIKDRIANFEKGKPVVNGKSEPDSKIPVHGVTVDSSVTDKSPALPPPPEFGDSVQLEIIPPPSGFNLSDNLESPTYNSAFHHQSDSSSVSTLSTLSDDHVDGKTKHSYEELIAPPPPGFDDNSEDTTPSFIPPPPDFGENKTAVKSNNNNKTVNKPFLSKPLSSWQCLDVLDWLDSIQMAQYKKSFQQHCIDGKKLGGLQRNDYIQLGVTQVGHRMTMERGIKKASNIITGTHL
uniref:SH3 and multiple ankyrin repeat domains protein 1-like isoform X4 n=1 Tax=Crassostrea virginica TaxID=6565 RepID=A0A8B8AI82_CRAVI|nr:SH3 and multiple ankyrin repeat domains protein 1-like isoform X4 [Crassostrea virginica]